MRAKRAIQILEMAAIAGDVENFTYELGDSLILPSRVAAQIVDDAGGEALAIAARALDMPSPNFQRILLFFKPEIGNSVDCGVPAVAALRPAQRPLRAGDAGRLARLDARRHARQVPAVAA